MIFESSVADAHSIAVGVGQTKAPIIERRPVLRSKRCDTKYNGLAIVVTDLGLSIRFFDISLESETKLVTGRITQTL